MGDRVLSFSFFFLISSGSMGFSDSLASALSPSSLAAGAALAFLAGVFLVLLAGVFFPVSSAGALGVVNFSFVLFLGVLAGY